MRPARAIDVVKRTLAKWSGDRATTQSAALAYYTAFSIAPLVLIAMAIAGSVFGAEAARGELSRELANAIGAAGANAIQSLVASAQREHHGLGAAVIGGAILLAGATGVFVQLQETLNLVWKASPAREWMGLKDFIRKRLLSFAMVLGLGFLLLVSLVANATLAAVGTYASGLLPGWATLVSVLNFVVPFVVTAFLFLLMFVYLPDKRVAWRHCFAPAIVTATLFTLGKYLIGFYLGHSAVASSFGAAGSLAVVLVWVYYSAQIVLLGAEMSYVLATS
jgi:membrane protein